MQVMKYTGPLLGELTQEERVIYRALVNLEGMLKLNLPKRLKLFLGDSLAEVPRRSAVSPDQQSYLRPCAPGDKPRKLERSRLDMTGSVYVNES